MTATGRFEVVILFTSVPASHLASFLPREPFSAPKDWQEQDLFSIVW